MSSIITVFNFSLPDLSQFLLLQINIQLNLLELFQIKNVLVTVQKKLFLELEWKRQKKLAGIWQTFGLENRRKM
jgi:hypothetical protein